MFHFYWNDWITFKCKYVHITRNNEAMLQCVDTPLTLCLYDDDEYNRTIKTIKIQEHNKNIPRVVLNWNLSNANNYRFQNTLCKRCRWGAVKKRTEQ